jgi:hypothetical protein
LCLLRIVHFLHLRPCSCQSYQILEHMPKLSCGHYILAVTSASGRLRLFAVWAHTRSPSSQADKSGQRGCPFELDFGFECWGFQHTSVCLSVHVCGSPRHHTAQFLCLPRWPLILNLCVLYILEGYSAVSALAKAFVSWGPGIGIHPGLENLFCIDDPIATRGSLPAHVSPWTNNMPALREKHVSCL